MIYDQAGHSSFGQETAEKARNNTNNDYDDSDNAMESVDPYTSFDIKNCGSFEELWIWDLAMSCGDDQTSGNCTCPYTEELMRKGLLSCSEARKCPKKCPICSTCLMLAGCDEKKAVGSVSAHGGSSGTATAAMFVTLMGICLCLAHKRTRDKGNKGQLEDSFLDNEYDRDNENMKVWMVPLDTVFAGEKDDRGGDSSDGSLTSCATDASTPSSDVEIADVIHESRWLDAVAAARKAKAVKKTKNHALSRTFKEALSRLSTMAPRLRHSDAEQCTPDISMTHSTVKETNEPRCNIFQENLDESTNMEVPPSNRSKKEDANDNPELETTTKGLSHKDNNDIDDKSPLFPESLSGSLDDKEEASPEKDTGSTIHHKINATTCSLDGSNTFPDLLNHAEDSMPMDSSFDTTDIKEKKVTLGGCSPEEVSRPLDESEEQESIEESSSSSSSSSSEQQTPSPTDRSQDSAGSLESGSFDSQSNDETDKKSVASESVQYTYNELEQEDGMADSISKYDFSLVSDGGRSLS